MKRVLTLTLLALLLAAVPLLADGEARIRCPHCNGYDTWATYEHFPCGTSATGTIWVEEAYGAEEDCRPYSRPCPAPGCFESHVPGGEIECRSCSLRW